MANGDLHYAVFSNGSYGLQDYPYLTYNDLFELQALLKEAGREPSAVLELLMQSKRRWMDANGVSGYLT